MPVYLVFRKILRGEVDENGEKRRGTSRAKLSYQSSNEMKNSAFKGREKSGVLHWTACRRGALMG